MLHKTVKYIKAKLRIKLFFSYSFIVIVPLAAMGIILFFVATNLSEKQTEINQSLYIQSVKREVEQYFRELELFTQSIYLGDIQQKLNENPTDIIKQVQKEHEIFKRIQQWSGLMDLNVQIENILFIPPKGIPMSLFPINDEFDFQRTDWYQEAIKREGKVYIFGPNSQLYSKKNENKKPTTFSLTRKVNNTLASDPLGVILIDINLKDLSKLIAPLEKTDNSNFMILNSKNQIIYQSHNKLNIGEQLQLTFKGDKGWVDFLGEKTFYNQYYFEKIGWRFVTLDPVENINKYSWYLRDITIFIGLIALAVAMALSAFISRKITKPLIMIQKEMKNIEKGKFKQQLPEDRTDEIGKLAIGFNRMSFQINTLINKVYKSEIREKEAQLKALHSQINPHFLYNTLDSMNALAILKDNYELSKMILLLADMFRYSISQGEAEVPLRKEIEQIKRYVKIQRIRYNDKFELEINIDEAMLDYPILKLSIQPLVENAIYHGLELLPGMGTIIINGYTDQHFAYIEVCDNGIGIPNDNLNLIRRRLQTKEDNDNIGIQNVHERIYHHYGDEYGLEIESTSNKGTRIIIKLPKI